MILVSTRRCGSGGTAALRTSRTRRGVVWSSPLTAPSTLGFREVIVRRLGTEYPIQYPMAATECIPIDLATYTSMPDDTYGRRWTPRRLRIRARRTPGQVAGAAKYTNGLAAHEKGSGCPSAISQGPWLGTALDATRAAGRSTAGAPRSIVIPVHHDPGLDWRPARFQRAWWPRHSRPAGSGTSVRNCGRTAPSTCGPRPHCRRRAGSEVLDELCGDLGGRVRAHQHDRDGRRIRRDPAPARQGGADDYVTKPLDVTRFLASLQRALDEE
jgi:hypothetical protein